MSDELQQMLSDTELHIGDIVSGTVILIDEKKVTVDIQAPFEAIIPIRELSPLHIEHPSAVINVGDAITAEVVKLDEEGGTIVLSKRSVDAKTAWQELREKQAHHTPFEVTIQDVVKGGLVTDVGVRGFIPASLIDVQFVKDLNDFKGQTVQVIVHELDEANNKLILSRKAVLEGDQKQHLQELVERLHPGDIVPGIVKRFASFGAFVEVAPGVDGLVHVSELAWHRVESPAEVVHIGDEINVRILQVDPEAGKISLSLKQAQPSPWKQSVSQIHEGDILEGTVKRVVDYGAFVEIAPGVEGLVHVSQIANHHVAKASDELTSGQTVSVYVLGIDFDRQRISLSIREANPKPAPVQSTRGPRRNERVSEYADDNQSGTGATFGDLFGDLFKRS